MKSLFCPPFQMIWPIQSEMPHCAAEEVGLELWAPAAAKLISPKTVSSCFNTGLMVFTGLDLNTATAFFVSWSVFIHDPWPIFINQRTNMLPSCSISTKDTVSKIIIVLFYLCLCFCHVAILVTGQLIFTQKKLFSLVCIYCHIFLDLGITFVEDTNVNQCSSSRSVSHNGERSQSRECSLLCQSPFFLFLPAHIFLSYVISQKDC